MRVPFANWQPDLQGLSNTGQQDTRNVYPTGGGGYGPVKSLMDVSTTALASQCLGAFTGQDSNGVANAFAGDTSKLYRLVTGAWTDVSKVGGYSAAARERWEFAQFGERIIATQITDPVQYYDMGSSSLFANLPGSPPSARHIGVVRDFVVLGNTVNSPNEVAWCGFNNTGQWTPGTNQSDTQTLQEDGPIRRIIGGEVGVIFQERAITRMLYVGPPTYFQFDRVEQARGVLAPGAIATVGTTSFYRGLDGFYSFDPANGSQPIGHDKVDLWFANNLQTDTFDLITAAADPLRKLVVFSFVSADATDASHPDTLLFYHWVSKEWAYAKIQHEIVFPALSQGLTLEGLSAIYPNIDTLVPFSLDSSVWAGGSAYLGMFSTAHQLATQTGPNLAALIETGDMEPVKGKRSLITNTLPLCDTSAATVLMRSRERFADTVVNTNSSDMMNNGDCPLLSEGRFHRAQLSIPAGIDWTYATGIDVDAQDAGEQ